MTIKQFLARESSTGQLYLLACDGSKGRDEPYRVFGHEVYDMDTSGDFDTGNVDIDLFELRPLAAGQVKCLHFPGDE